MKNNLTKILNQLSGKREKEQPTLTNPIQAHSHKDPETSGLNHDLGNEKSQTHQQPPALSAVTMLIIDQSGSMSSLIPAVKESYYGIIDKIKAELITMPELKQYVNLWLFNGNKIEEAQTLVEIKEAGDLEQVNFYADGSTPLLDTMGKGLISLESKLASMGLDNQYTLVNVGIFTDGEENSSREFHINEIQRMVTRLKDKQWKFQYYGTDHDVEAMAASLHIDESIKFTKSREAMVMESKKFSGTYAIHKSEFIHKNWLKDADFD